MSDVSSRLDGRRLRGAARRAAWRAVLHAIDVRAVAQPPTEVAAHPACAELYWATVRAVLAFLSARADGRLVSPPGGVRP